MNQALFLRDNVSFQDEHPAAGDSRDELLAGLRAEPKTIDPKYFYDALGSRLFARITRLPEYYPTRTEVGILHRHRQQIAAHCGVSCVFIEPGSGNCEKVRLLLDAVRPSLYVPVDISSEFLRAAALQLGGEYPWLAIAAVCADFNASWDFTRRLPLGKRVVFYPGSTIGNLEPADAVRFLARVKEVVGAGGGALIGVDLHKDSACLTAAYNDAQGVTARFNLNVLLRLNRILEADFEPAQFRHRAFYNTDRQRIEMHLVSQCEQSVGCNGSRLRLRQGESIHTENSYKYTVQGFAALAAAAGLALERSWLDDEALFSVHYLRAT
ncbi:MAG: L-histidine N(alpha)-methyltransferase [Halioglobus sp.]|nr:L-histidine N(alpha)-methyltransferase [Halioglobus sp.]